MTLPATLSITAGSIGLLAALLAFGMSYAPGWRELRWFALGSVFAALFSFANAPMTLDVGERVPLLASRLELFFGGLHAATWFKFTATQENRSMSRGERIWVSSGVLASVLALVPGLIIQDRVVARAIPALHVTYTDAPPTTIGLLSISFYVVSVGLVFVRVLRRRLRGDRKMTTHAIAIGAVILGGVHDGLSVADVIRSPYLLDLSLLVLVLAVGGSITSRFVASARALEASSRELEAAHRELVEKERLAALGELAAVVAHEVRNPLAVVFNATAGLRRAHPGGADYTALVEIVQEEAERLRDIVTDLLEFARPRPTVLATIAFEEVVRNAVAAACSVAGAESKQVVVQTTTDVGSVTCDDRLVRQAIVNLVANAIQAEGRTAPVIVELLEKQERVVVRVTDDGNGVPEELRARIFTPFFSTRPKGTGLGLTVVRRCADAHGGDILLESARGRGTTFELQLPRREG